jgi:MoxR-like ATPase
MKQDELQKVYAALIEQANPPLSPKPNKATKTPVTQDADKILQAAEPVINDLGEPELPSEDPDLEDLASGNMGAIEQYEQTNLPTYNYKSLYLFLNMAYDTKEPLLIYGDPGIGKSDVVRNLSESIAKSKGRKYENWNKTSNEQKQDILKNPREYFVLIDVRTAQLEPTDLIGIPDISSKAGYLETKQPKWIWYMSQPESDGILFLDELNQGSEQILKALFELVNDRSAGGISFSEDFSLVAAGNLGAEFNDPIPQALTNRFSAGVLIADPEGWLEYATQAGIDKRIIAFVKSNTKDNFYVKPKNPDDPFPSPRQMTKLSKQLKHIYTVFQNARKQGRSIGVDLYKVIGDKAAQLCGVEWARKFMTFLQYIRDFDIKAIMQNIDKLPKEQVDKLHALMVFIVNKARIPGKKLENNEKLTPDDVEIIHGIVKISNVVKKEFKVILWSLIKRELPPGMIAPIMEYIVNGDYDPKDKETFIKVTSPIIKELAKGT